MQSPVRTAFMCALLSVATVVFAQDTKRPADTSSALTLTGCVSEKPLISGDFTFIDTATGTKYRLNGKGLKKYAGQQVEIISRPDKSFAVKGGLFPSPNIAAQAGGLDPAQEAIARQPGGAASGTAATELPEFRVARVRTVPGACQ